MVKIEVAHTNTHSKAELDQLYHIIIKGYEITEVEIWGENYVRISRPDYDRLIDREEVLIAKIGDKVVGGIHGYQISESAYTFSLLATDFAYAGMGAGKALIKAVEDKAKLAGCNHIKIEVLRVKELDTSSKIRLDKFYKELGYVYTHSEDCICKIPEKKYLKLKAPSDFDFYDKVI